MPFPGEQFIIRVWETMERCGVGLLSPAQIKREGKARAEVRRAELLLDARTRQDLEDVKAGRKWLDERGHLLPAPHREENRAEPTLLIPPMEPNALLELAAQREAVRATEKLLNIRQIAVYAEE